MSLTAIMYVKAKRMLDYVKCEFTLAGKHPAKSEYRDSKKEEKTEYANFKISCPNKDNFSSSSKLDVKITYYHADDKSKVQITGSWRKWFYTEGTTRDLTYNDTLECIRLIAITLVCKESDVKRAKFVKAELGYNIRIKKRIENLADGFVDYKGWKRAWRYDKESVKWTGGNYSVAFYDKHLQIMKEIKSKPHLTEKLNKNRTCLRYEVRFNEIQKAPKKLKSYLSSVKNYLEHWEDSVNAIGEIYQDVIFIPYALPLGLKHLEGKKKSEFDIYKTFITASALGGLDKYFLALGKLDGKNRRRFVKQEKEVLNNPPAFIKNLMEDCTNVEEDLEKARQKKVRKLLRSKKV